MIHHSNPKCDICGERHSIDNILECRDCLKRQLDEKCEVVNLMPKIEAFLENIVENDEMVNDDYTIKTAESLLAEIRATK